ncbi:MAG: hypothetical protein WCU00_06840, partial [Candidatus Latescibacterota bacterium]
MKTKIITLVMILSALFAVVSFAQEIDPGTGIKIGALDNTAIWSPDGKFIASSGLYPDRGIFIYSIDNNTSQKIYNSAPYNQGSLDYGAGYPCYSPDGKEVYFETRFLDKSRGTTVEYTSWGDSTVNNLIPVIMAVNVTTHGVRVVKE